MMNLSTKIIFVFAFAVFNTSSALSCSCADPSVRNKFRSANSVFIGHVVDMSPFNSDDFPLGTSLVKFKVEKQWKGPRRPAIPGIADVDEPGMCSDLNLTVGKRYLIYASSEKGRLRIYTDCGPNRAAEHAEDEVSNSKGSGFDFTLASILIQKFKVYQLSLSLNTASSRPAPAKSSGGRLMPGR
jgi:hypothetical protein